MRMIGFGDRFGLGYYSIIKSRAGHLADAADFPRNPRNTRRLGCFSDTGRPENVIAVCVVMGAGDATALIREAMKLSRLLRRIVGFRNGSCVTSNAGQRGDA